MSTPALTWYDPTPTALQAWSQFLARVPIHVRRVAKAYPIWCLYRMRTSGRVVHPLSYLERFNGTGVLLTVRAPQLFNPVAGEACLHEISPNSLEPYQVQHIHALDMLSALVPTPKIAMPSWPWPRQVLHPRTRSYTIH